jgi:hypothetical protein
MFDDLSVNKILRCNHYFSTLNTSKRKEKYPDPEHCLKGMNGFH